MKFSMPAHNPRLAHLTHALAAAHRATNTTARRRAFALASRRILKLSSVALDCLRERRRQQAEDRAALGGAWQNTGFVFTQIKGTRMNPDNLRREMHRLCEKAGVRPVTIHTLRDTYATLLRREGVELEVISKYLGHEDPMLTARRYRQVQPDELEACTIDLLGESRARRGQPNPGQEDDLDEGEQTAAQ
ncbi:tyrosine-type recombinase/integrase [Deinococcus apachensis]|uniref:tyrosine-type recombinase/integrase n=1 Tax=Deinococcus apachensis TaxID=309886 RepID=UPI0003A8250C|nr:tyrosine-type recombinase/integrase [Deinococcus apachensis]